MCGQGRVWAREAESAKKVFVCPTQNPHAERSDRSSGPPDRVPGRAGRAKWPTGWNVTLKNPRGRIRVNPFPAQCGRRPHRVDRLRGTRYRRAPRPVQTRLRVQPRGTWGGAALPSRSFGRLDVRPRGGPAPEASPRAPRQVQTRRSAKAVRLGRMGWVVVGDR